jgi:hypothetical protein
METTECRSRGKTRILAPVSLAHALHLKRGSIKGNLCLILSRKLRSTA